MSSSLLHEGIIEVWNSSGFKIKIKKFTSSQKVEKGASESYRSGKTGKGG
jgi:hypothetical protein